MMTTEPLGSARLVLGRVQVHCGGRYAIAIPTTGEAGETLYDVYFSDSQRTETHVSHEHLLRLKGQGHTVIVAGTPQHPEHTL